MDYTLKIRSIMHGLMVSGKGTRDLCGPNGLTTEAFVSEVAKHLLSEKAYESDVDLEEVTFVPTEDPSKARQGKDDDEFVLKLFQQVIPCTFVPVLRFMISACKKTGLYSNAFCDCREFDDIGFWSICS